MQLEQPHRQAIHKMMLAYPLPSRTAAAPAAMMAPGFFPQPMAQMPTFPLGAHLALTPTFLHAQIPAMQQRTTQQRSVVVQQQCSDKSQSPKTPPSKSLSFSIDSILCKGQTDACSKDSEPKATHSPAATNSNMLERLSPTTPLSATRNGVFYFYTSAPPAPCSPFSFAATSRSFEPDLQRSPLGPLSAPVTVIADMMRGAGTCVCVHPRA